MQQENGKSAADLSQEADALISQAQQTDAAPSKVDALSISVLTFVLIIVGLMTYLIRIGRNGESVLRAFGVPMIIGAAVFLVVAGFSEHQITPVIGLLGTIAGYLLGKATSADSHTPPAPPTKPAEVNVATTQGTGGNTGD
jgi:hypothetical protein